MSAALETRALCKQFGGLVVADNIDFCLEAGARHALIGPNGAGKTTFVNMLTGRLAPTSGAVLLAGEEITGLSQPARVKRGVGRTFQISSLFPDLTVLDNVAIGVAERRGVAGRWWRPASTYAEVRDEAMELLALLGLADEARRPVIDLAYGEQRLVEIAIALGLKPRVLLLDEPAAGVPSLAVPLVLRVLAALPKDIAILIIEHDMDLVYQFAERITVLVQGKVLCAGTPAEISSDPRVHQVYLGERHAPEPRP
jgi:branched-chain amino acid transport system ATP-binding protein